MRPSVNISTMQEANNTPVVADTEPQSSFGIRKIVDCKLDKVYCFYFNIILEK